MKFISALALLASTGTAAATLSGSCDYSVTTGDSIEFPSGAFEVVSTDGDTLTFSINQLWKTSDSISWIAPIYTPVGESSLTCEGSDKVDEVSFEQTVGPFTAQCSGGVADIVVAVHDGSFTQAGVANEDVYGCDGWPKPEGVAVYELQVPCCESSTPESCDYSVTTGDSIDLPSGAFQVVATDGDTVSFSVNQLWKTSDSISWIAPIYTPVGESSLTCEGSDKVDEVVFEQTVGPFTAQCSDGVAEIVVAVHDGSFTQAGVANEDVYGCDGWPKPDGVAVYNFEVPCCESSGDTETDVEPDNEPDVEPDVEPNDHCVGDMTLLDVEGSTTYDQIPFTIVSQDTDSVTLKLQALWFDGVDVQYTQYSENFVEKCIAEDDVSTASIEEITVSCPGSEHIALVTVVGSGDSLDAALDTAEAPQCCHADGDNSPKVKFTFMVSCVSQCPTESRRLRGA